MAWSAPVKVTNEAGRVVNLFPGIYQTESQGPRLIWLSTRTGGVDLFEQSTAQVGQYPNGVTRVSEVGGGYSHRVVWTGVPGVYLGVWVGGPDGAQEIWYRFFER